MNNILEIYTDGSSLGNPGKGGWAAIFLGKKNIKEIAGQVKDVTNNQMELLAVIKSFEYLNNKNIENYKIIIKSDSKYFIDGIEKWILNWQKNNWKTAAKKEVKNKDLWKKILFLEKKIKIKNEIFFEHIFAHTGEKYNERVDDLARWLAEGKKIKLLIKKRKDYDIFLDNEII